MNLTDKYLGEAATTDKNEFWQWLREKKSATCTIFEGGMILAICVGKVQVKGGGIPEFQILGSKSEIHFPYAAFNASTVKTMGKDAWHLTVMKGNLTYEVY